MDFGHTSARSSSCASKNSNKTTSVVYSRACSRILVVVLYTSTTCCHHRPFKKQNDEVVSVLGPRTTVSKYKTIGLVILVKHCSMVVEEVSFLL